MSSASSGSVGDTATGCCIVPINHLVGINAKVLVVPGRADS